MNGKYRLNLFLGLLFTAKSIPATFFLMGLPIILRLQGQSLSAIGLFQLASVPYLLKFLWAPVLDRNSYRKNHYKFWILVTGSGIGIWIFLLGLFRPDRQLQVLFAMIMGISLLTATLDIAISSLYIKLLSYEERGLGATGKILAANTAAIFSNGLLILVYNHWGWTILTNITAGVIFFSLAALFFIKEPGNEGEGPQQAIISWAAIWSFFLCPGMIRWMILLASKGSSITAVFFMIKPLLVDQGYNPDTIAFLTGIFAVAVGALSALATGMKKVQHFILRRRASLIFCVVFNAGAVALFVPAYFLGCPIWLLYAAVTTINVALSFASVVSGTLIMDFSRTGSEGVDYSLQMTAIHGGGLIMAAISGYMVETIGYGNFFIFHALLGLVLIFFVSLLFRGDWTP